MSNRKVGITSAAVLLLAAGAYANFTFVRTTGPSMSPTIPAEGAWIIVDKYLWKLRRITSKPPLKVGEVVVFKQSRNGREFSACKRIKAVSGSMIEVEGTGGTEKQHASSIYVPPDHLWLQGDCAKASRDSRYYGAVPTATVWGRVLSVMKPWPRRV